MSYGWFAVFWCAGKVERHHQEMGWDGGRVWCVAFLAAANSLLSGLILHLQPSDSPDTAFYMLQFVLCIGAFVIIMTFAVVYHFGCAQMRPPDSWQSCCSALGILITLAVTITCFACALAQLPRLGAQPAARVLSIILLFFSSVSLVSGLSFYCCPPAPLSATSANVLPVVNVHLSLRSLPRHAASPLTMPASPTITSITMQMSRTQVAE